MNEIKIESNLLESICYKERRLLVTLKDGKVFSYSGVSQELFDKLAGACSPHKFYNKNIVPCYSFQRIK